MFSVTNLFSPNQDQVLFCLCSLKLFKEFAEGTIILAGDLNLILDNSMDTTGRPSLSGRNLHKLRNEMHMARLFDWWRVLHLVDKEFSYFSVLHNTYSQINHICVLNSLMDMSPTTQIDNIL